MCYVFIYGTLKNPATLKKAIGRMPPTKKEILQGYEKIYSTFKKEQYPFIIKNHSKYVEGLLINVTREELKKLDLWEDHIYVRKKIKLSNGKKAYTFRPKVFVKIMSRHLPQ